MVGVCGVGWMFVGVSFGVRRFGCGLWGAFFGGLGVVGVVLCWCGV